MPGEIGVGTSEFVMLTLDEACIGKPLCEAFCHSSLMHEVAGVDSDDCRIRGSLELILVGSDAVWSSSGGDLHFLVDSTDVGEDLLKHGTVLSQCFSEFLKFFLLSLELRLETVGNT